MLRTCKPASFLAGFLALDRAFEASSEARSFSEACLVIIVSISIMLSFVYYVFG